MNQPFVQSQLEQLRTRDTGLSGWWSVIAVLAVGIMLISLVFWREIQAAVEVWNASTAYSHCYLVVPMALYLLWERRDLLIGARAEPELGATLAALPLTVFWLLAERLGIMEARQLAVIAGFELLFFTVLGRRLFRLLSGPLLFLFFLVPFGAFLTPILQQFTATFSITGLDILGIPNFSDGFTIETPAGVFFVAEACAGLRFLIASIAFGVFYSLLSYTSFIRRLLFIAASVVVPILANGFRALGIVVLGQVLGSAEAAAADHIIYGWVFFSVVMLLLIAGGHAFRQAQPSVVSGLVPGSATPKQSPLWCLVAVVLLLGLGPALASIIDSRSAAPVLSEADTIVAPSGCLLSSASVAGSSERLLRTVVCDGVRFEVSVVAFAARSTSSAMISERRRVTQEVGAENASVSVLETAKTEGYWTLVQTTAPNRVTAYAGWVDGLPIANSIGGRIAQAHDSIFGAAYAPALITITAAESPNSLPADRKEVVETLTRLVRAQSGLGARMTALTRLRQD